MTTKEQVAELLLEELSYVYCYNCANDLDEDLCGDCHRKYMNWKLAPKTANKLADIIDDIYSNVKENQDGQI